MPELRLVPLDEILKTTQLKKLERELAEVEVDEVPIGEDIDTELEESLTEDQLTDFMDRLEAHDLACDIFLPVEFEGRIELGDQSVGSAFTLLEALEEIREELDIDEDAADDEDEDLDMDVLDEHLHYAWRMFLRAANTCIEKQVPLYIQS